MTTSALCVGEALVDFLAQTHTADVGRSNVFHRAAGGAVANVAVGIARLGGRSSFVGAVSNDAFGHFLVRTLASEGVNVDDVNVVDAHTTLAFVARGEAGARDFMFVRNPGADSLLTVADVNRVRIGRGDALHFGGVLLSSEPARSACLRAAARASEAGALVTFDPNVRPALFGSAHDMRTYLLAGCAAAQLVKLSEEDAAALGLSKDDAHDLLGDTTKAVVLSRGAQGCSYFTTDGGKGDIAAPKVDVVDTTGAGDAMMAAVIWRLATRHDRTLSAATIADAALAGCAAGALACRKEGAIPSLPTARELNDMLSRVASQA